MNISSISRFAHGLGIEICRELDPALLVPQESIRAFCVDNKCGNYGSNYMCPPHIGSTGQMEARLRKFQRGVLLQYSKPVNVAGDHPAVTQVKVEFHHKILQLEEFLKIQGEGEVWGMIGGSCGLCQTCGAKSGEPCPHPDRARTSLEALGINVLALMRKLGLDNRFHPDRVTWTGCVLYNQK